MAVQSSFFRLITNDIMQPKSISPRIGHPRNAKFKPITFRKHINHGLTKVQN